MSVASKAYRSGKTSSKGFCFFTVLLITLLTSFWYWTGNYGIFRLHISRNTVFEPIKDSVPQTTKPEVVKPAVILMWTEFYANISDVIPTARSWDPKCCQHVEITSDRSRLEEATAVVFRHASLSFHDLPRKRTPQQLWTILCQEAPRSRSFISSRAFDGLFNLTMSYRLDSDIFAPYGHIVKRDKPLGRNEPIAINNVTLDAFIKGKSKLVTTVNSHCHTWSGREEVIRKIQEDIDVYGKCGVSELPPQIDAFRNLSRKYRFYFAAENSVCHDYITEKFWRSLEIGMVPVVYGGGNYSAVAPPHSYIDSRDFASPRELVDYLRKLEREPEEYRKYFEWRRRYEARTTDGWHAFCDLCKVVTKHISSLKKSSSVKPRVHVELGKWWSTKPHLKGHGDSCSAPRWVPRWKLGKG